MAAITNDPVSPSSSLLAAMNGKSNTSSGSSSSVSAAQNQFMTLLVTQMKNQDPLNPMDNSQVTSQLAQLSTVSGINTLNATVQTLLASYQSSQTLQAASMIGQSVLTPGNTMTLANGAAPFGVDVTTASGAVQVAIKNAIGTTVDTMNLGPQQVGSMPLAWDGTMASGAKAPDGQYTFSVTASTNGQPTNGASELVYGKVNSVTTGTAGVTLNVENVGAVNLSSVVQIF
jgi:flagellar basal-body rod modification protein FlgD